MDSTALQQTLGVLLCAVILWRTEPALNRMGPAAPNMIRLSFTLLATAAVGGIIAILAGRVPGPEGLMLAAGTAALLICDRRIRILTRPRPIKKGPSHAQG